jgi:tRNA dimethylallyltransferase
MAQILIIGGPTAAGKTDLAIEIAEAYGAALVSADAMTVYRGMDIGTAKPPRSVLDRLPHGAIDVREVDEDWSVADFVEAVEAAARQHRRVVVVGGTPFYLSALVRPLADLPAANPDLRAELEALDDPHGRLSIVDPASAARLHPNDRVRVLRALEVSILAGQPMSALWAAGPRAPALVPMRALCWMDREDLRARIAARVGLMVEQGYVAEVEALLARGFDLQHKPMRSFAYVHLIGAVRGELSLEEALRRTDRDTATLARKQRTWGRGLGLDPDSADQIREKAARVFVEAAGLE